MRCHRRVGATTASIRTGELTASTTNTAVEAHELHAVWLLMQAGLCTEPMRTQLMPDGGWSASHSTTTNDTRLISVSAPRSSTRATSGPKWCSQSPQRRAYCVLRFTCTHWLGRGRVFCGRHLRPLGHSSQKEPQRRRDSSTQNSRDLRLPCVVGRPNRALSLDSQCDVHTLAMG